MAQQTLDNLASLLTQRNKINDNATDAQARLPAIVINAKSDLPTPAAGVITITETDVRYLVCGLIDLGTDRIEVTGLRVQFEGLDPSSGFLYSGSLALITTSSTMHVNGMNLVGMTATHLIDATDAGTDTLLFISCGFVGGTSTDLVSIDNYANAFFDLCGFVSGRKGILLAQAVTNFTVTFSQFQIGVVGINIDLNGALCSAIAIETCVSELSATSTFISAAVDNGNITAQGGGTITHNKVDDSEVGSVLSVGLSPLDSRWTAIGNNNLTSSDRLNPTGWAFYDDSDTTPTVVPSGIGNAVLFEVDGAGANSNSLFAPRVVRGISEMWDTSTNEMVPITLGDSFTTRIAFELTSKSGNPNLITFVFDIGGAAGITIPIYTTSLGTPNSFPHPNGFQASVFSLATFLANGGRIFMYTDSGTITVEKRQVLIQRISSGAS